MEQKCSTPNHRSRTSGDKRPSCLCCRKLMGAFFSPFGLTILFAGYVIFGAYLFKAFEGSREIEKSTEVTSLRDITVQKMWNITDKFNVLYKENWTAMVSKEMVLFEQQLVQAIKDGFDGEQHQQLQQHQLPTSSSPSSSSKANNKAQNQPRRQWTFSGSFLYSLTVITTIGCGQTAPRTDEGKILTIFYATFGIPLTLLYLTTIGSSLAKSFRSIYGKMFSCSNEEQSSDERSLRTRSRNSKHHHLNHQNSISSNHQVAANALSAGTSGTLVNNHTAYVATCNHHHHHCHQPMWTNGGVTLIDPMATDLGAFKLAGTEASFEITAESIPVSNDIDNYYEEKAPERTFDSVVRVPISLSLALMVAYVLIGGKFFSTWNKSWTFVESAYFSFVSLSTIGYAFPGKGVTPSGISSPEKWLVLCSLYIMVGLILIAMCFHLIHDEILHKTKSWGKRSKLDDVIKEPDDLYGHELDVL
ncbi:Potassium channel subfamily K member 15 [Halotydeus destructor]|nr:Potassium channel subfamily K member 15 [Halotydeus destructor]